ncbi:MAG: hypothetical protein ACLPUT_14595 [Solirubrobacteraceae bacterium]
MKRVQIVGLCLVAVVAFSAMVASAAQAAEVGVCLKTSKVEGKYSGQYLEKGCLALATSEEVAEGAKNEYEWYPGTTAIGVDGTTSATFQYTSKSSKVHLRMPSTIIKVLGHYTDEAAIVCKSSTDSGEWTGPGTDVDTIVFAGCVLKISEKEKGYTCTSAGQSPGEIKTSRLNSSLVGNPEQREQIKLNEISDELEEYLVGPAEGKVWVEYSPAPGEPLAVYGCEHGVTFKTAGAIAGTDVSRVNAMGRKLKVSFGPGSGLQDLQSEYSEDGGETYEPIGPIVVSTDNTIKDGGKVEIKS